MNTIASVYVLASGAAYLDTLEYCRSLRRYHPGSTVLGCAVPLATTGREKKLRSDVDAHDESMSSASAINPDVPSSVVALQLNAIAASYCP